MEVQATVIELDSNLPAPRGKPNLLDFRDVIKAASQENGVNILASCKINEEGKVYKGYNSHHGFLDALGDAFFDHRSFAISPDDIWLLIVQGFGDHMEHNHEALRQHFVDFDGKKTLVVERSGFGSGDMNLDWEGVFAEFSTQIKENIGETNHSTIMTKFSTTSIIQMASQEVSLMTAMKHYFEYCGVGECGFPKVRLEGNLEDWKLIHEKAQGLAQYDFDWWIEKILPIIEKFIEAKTGKVDKEFWETIFKLTGGGSGEAMSFTGWITNFFPYPDAKANKTMPSLQEFIDEMRKQKITGSRDPDTFLIGQGKVPTGVSKCPFKYIDDSQTENLLWFFAGFAGYTIEEGFVKPQIGWAVSDRKE